MATPASGLDLSASVKTEVCSTLSPDLSSIDDPEVLKAIVVKIYGEHLQLEKDLAVVQKSYIEGMERELGLLERFQRVEAENKELLEKISGMQKSLDEVNKFFEA